MKSFEEVRAIVADMQSRRSPVIAKMREIMIRYEGDYVIPLPEMSNEPALPPLTPSLVTDAIDSLGSRAASVLPRVASPAIDPMRDTGVRSTEFATLRRKILAATYSESKWRLKRRGYYRHLAAYQTCAVMVVPDYRTKMPRLEVRDPLVTFVEERPQQNQDSPRHVAFVTRYSGAWVRERFPQTASENGGPITPFAADVQWDIFEYVDTEQTMYGLLGPQYHQGAHIAPQYSAGPHMQLGESEPNVLGYVPGMFPANVSLGQIGSRLGSMLGMVDMQAKLMALDIIAQERAVFPDVYAIGREGQLPRLTDGRWKDGREGDINMMEGVERIGLLQTSPDIRTQAAVDRLERNFNRSAGVIPQFAGENPGSLRTGRALDAIASYSVDPRIQEMHEISQDWMPTVNEAIFDTYKALWPSRKYTVFSGWPGDDGIIEFTPTKHIETSKNTVTYPVPGADLVQLTQILGSLAGTEAISVDTMRELHPWIPDTAGERRRVTTEQLEVATRQALQMQLTQGTMPLPLAKMIVDRIKVGKDLFDAIAEANEELQRQQAQAVPEAPEGMEAAPETMPGFAAGPDAALGPAAVDTGGGAGMNDEAAMAQIMAALRGG